MRDKTMNKTHMLIRGTILIITMTMFMISGCSEDKNKAYIVQKIQEMYSQVSDIDTRLRDSLKAISKAKTSAEIAAARRQTTEPIAQFNHQCETIVLNDPILKSYFEGFCQKMNGEKEITIEKLNFYGIKTRMSLQEDLGIKLAE